MQRRRILAVVVAALALAGAATGYWFLSGQQVTVQVYYAQDTAGRVVAVSVDGREVGAFVVPNFQSCIGGAPCGGGTLGDAWLVRGLHAVHVAVNGTAAIDRDFTVSGRAYAWIEVYWDGHADFGIGEIPPVWA